MGGGFKPSIVESGWLSLLLPCGFILTRLSTEHEGDWGSEYRRARLAGGNACDDIRLATYVVDPIHGIYPLKQLHLLDRLLVFLTD